MQLPTPFCFLVGMYLALSQESYVGPLFVNGPGLLIFLILCTLAKPDITGHRFVALCLSLVDALLLFRRSGILAPVSVLLVPLSLIWFAEVFSALRGNVGHGGGVINTETPAWMIAGFGWMVLLFLSGVIIYHSF